MDVRKTPLVKDHMESLGLSFDSELDKYIYASWIESGQVPTPRSLRGYRHFLGIRYNRKHFFISKCKSALDQAVSGL